MMWIGIDPGKSGGIAVIDDEGIQLWCLERLTESEVADALRALRGHATTAYLEDPRGILPGIRTPKSIAGPAESYGFLRGVLVALPIRFESVRPLKWQTPFKLPKRKDVGDTVKKQAHRQAAQRLWPNEKITNWSADAVLIAEYGRRERGMGAGLTRLDAATARQTRTACHDNTKMGVAPAGDA